MSTPSLTPDPNSPGTEGEEMRKLVERLRSWGENDPDEAYFEGDALACLLIDCGKSSDTLARLHADLTAAREERDTLRETVAQLKDGEVFLREVYEATIARWRDAAILAVGGDLRKVQRLLDASRQRITGSVLRELSDEEKNARAAALVEAHRREREAGNA